ncbi:hypothetical protein F8S13_01255 [Chloroflexia bacterium SDU3-3]|nr:hypothetical protein F8S13_01255 [Chloroflexia bacterium SDU3-3]
MLMLYAATMFLGATLLFMVQPMFARMVLPLLGGSPAVWNTAMLFYQVALLAGYGYAHLITRRLAARSQVLLHGALLLLPLVVLPLAVPAGWQPPTDTSPVWWLLGLLAVAVGLPFFVVSTTSPLLQAWFARTSHPLAADPYPLYAASNVGSMLALLAYPTLIEPALRLGDQSRIWAGGYVLLAGLTLACALVVWRGAGVVVPPADAPERDTSSRQPITMLRRARWVLLAFVPSSLMLSVTAYLSTNIAPVPLLWTIPLALYLLTFILLFGGRTIPHQIIARALPILMLPLVFTLAAQATGPLLLLLPLHLLVFFVVAMVCHGQMALDRPEARHLTEFYLWMSVGGALGGVFNSLVAPLVFRTVLEYPLVLVLACMLNANLQRAAPQAAAAVSPRRALPWRERLAMVGRPLFRLNGIAVSAWDMILPLGLGLLTAVLVLGTQRLAFGATQAGVGVMFGVPALLCFLLSRRPLRFALGVAAILLAAGLYVNTQGQLLHVERTFFGTHRVLLSQNGQFHQLAHGPTLHGTQSLDPARRDTPLSYYYASGPAGQLFGTLGPTRRSVAVVGLGVGSLACYRQPGQAWTFYEIDAAVERIARDPQFFTFLADCAGDTPVRLGDARLTLGEASPQSYDLLVMDAYTSDSVPIHLLTREALAMYTSKLASGGVLAFHISNQFFDLHPVLSALADDAGLVALAQDDLAVSAEESAAGKHGSQWVVMARSVGDLGALADDPRWYRLQIPGAPLWTDDYSSILGVLKLR